MLAGRLGLGICIKAAYNLSNDECRILEHEEQTHLGLRVVLLPPSRRFSVTVKSIQPKWQKKSRNTWADEEEVAAPIIIYATHSTVTRL